LAARRLRSQEPVGEHLQRRVARRVEKVQVLDPEQHGLLSSASQDQVAEGLEQTRTASLGLQLRRRQRGIGGPEQLEPEGQRDRVDGRHPRQAAPHGVSDFRRRGAVVDAEESPRELDDRVEGEHAPVGERAGLVERRTPGALDELVTQAALARAGFSGDQDDLRSTGPCLVQGPLEQRELMLPADEARKAARA
jgi:hypothetical protein